MFRNSVGLFKRFMLSYLRRIDSLGNIYLLKFVGRFLYSTTAPSSRFMVRPIIISGPSGGGKSTILTKAMKEHPNTFEFSVSHTTRKPRPGEIPDKHYHFTSYDEMKRMVENNELFEYAEFGGNMYGTSKREVERIQNSGKICILDVNLQGVRNFKVSDIDAKYIFIKTPCIDTLEKRLRQRGTETEESIMKRINTAKCDLHSVSQTPGLFDHVIVNDVLDKAYAEFLDAISEELKAYAKKHPSN